MRRVEGHSEIKGSNWWRSIQIFFFWDKLRWRESCTLNLTCVFSLVLIYVRLITVLTTQFLWQPEGAHCQGALSPLPYVFSFPISVDFPLPRHLLTLTLLHKTHWAPGIILLMQTRRQRHPGDPKEQWQGWSMLLLQDPKPGSFSADTSVTSVW